MLIDFLRGPAAMPADLPESVGDRWEGHYPLGETGR